MPTIQSRCREPLCAALCEPKQGRCEEHARPAYERVPQRVLSRHERGYGSRWEKLRAVVLRRDCSLCQPCLVVGDVTLATIVDHITPKAWGGADAMENLQAICSDCHTAKTALESGRGAAFSDYEPQWMPRSVVPVTVVCGPPGSGKSTYVQANSIKSDFIFDVDVIAAMMFDRPIYHSTPEERIAALRNRNIDLERLSKTKSGGAAWLIVTAGTPLKREFWFGLYGPGVTMQTPKSECKRRVLADARRPESSKSRAIAAINRWF